MNMSSRSLFATVAAGLLAGGSATAAVSLSITDGVGNPMAVSLTPGSTFSFTLSLVSTAEQTLGLSYRVEAPGAGSGQFRLTARDTSGSTYSDLVTGNAIALQPGVALLDPANDDDLGGLVADIFAPNGIGAFNVANLSFTALPGTAPGIYTIRTTANSIATDASFNDLALAPVNYTVTVVPEPTSVLFGLALLGVIAGPRRRRA